MNRRFIVYWILFIVSTISLAGISGWFVVKENRRFDESVSVALESQLRAAQDTVTLLTDEIMNEASRQLVGFHVEGLEYRLERWVKENEVVSVGFTLNSAGEVLRWGNELEDIPTDFSEENIRLLKREDLSALVSGESSDFGYLAENMDLYTYMGKSVEPKVLWYAIDRGGAFLDLLCVHSIAEGEVLRGIILNHDFLLSTFENAIQSLATAEVEFAFENNDSLETDLRGRKIAALSDLFSSILLGVYPTEVIDAQANLLRLFSVSIIVLLLLLSGGGTLLILNAYRSQQEVLQKATFVTSVSHELKTPLTSIRMFADLLKNTGIGEDKRAQYTGTISRESQRLTSMINNLLTYSGLEHGKKQYRLREFDLADVVWETISDYRATIEISGMTLESILPEVELLVKFDPSVVKQVTINLIENALKHAREGRYLQVEVKAEAKCAEVVVSDRGAGIVSGLREKIFEPFVQGQDNLSDKKSGAGLGLSIARAMMRDCGGELELLNTKAGAAFVMRINYTA